MAIKSSIEIVSAFISRTRNKEFVKAIINKIAPAFTGFSKSELGTSIVKERRPQFPTILDNNVAFEINKSPKINIFQDQLKIKSTLQKEIDPETYRDNQLIDYKNVLEKLADSPHKTKKHILKYINESVTQIEKDMTKDEKLFNFKLRAVKGLIKELGVSHQKSTGKFSNVRINKTPRNNRNDNDQGISF